MHHMIMNMLEFDIRYYPRIVMLNFGIDRIVSIILILDDILMNWYQVIVSSLLLILYFATAAAVVVVIVHCYNC